jgi:hypothetical protein
MPFGPFRISVRPQDWFYLAEMAECAREASFGGAQPSQSLTRLAKRLLRPPCLGQTIKLHRSDLGVALRCAREGEAVIAMLPTMLAVSSLATMEFQYDFTVPSMNPALF